MDYTKTKTSNHSFQERSINNEYLTRYLSVWFVGLVRLPRDLYLEMISAG